MAGTILAGLLCAGGDAWPAVVMSLNRVESVRSQALGGATTALGGDPALVWLNPASSVHASSALVSLGGQKGYFGDITTNAIGAVPLGFGVASVGFASYDSGPITLTSNDGESREVTGNKDTMGILGLGVSINDAVAAGVMVKGIRSELFEESTASAVAVDLGVQARITDYLKFGALVRNAGTNLRYLEDSRGTTLPTSCGAGAVFGWRFSGSEMADSRASVILVMSDVEYSLVDHNYILRFGSEYQWNGILTLRGGSQLDGSGNPGIFTVGVGIVLAKLRLDVSSQAGNNRFDVPWSVGFSFMF